MNLTALFVLRDMFTGSYNAFGRISKSRQVWIGSCIMCFKSWEEMMWKRHTVNTECASPIQTLDQDKLTFLKNSNLIVVAN